MKTMKLIISAGAIAVSGLLFGLSTQTASAAGYLKFDPAQNGSVDYSNSGKLKIIKYSWGKPGKDGTKPMVITRYVDLSSGIFTEINAFKETIPAIDVVVPAKGSNGKAFTDYHLTGVKITSYDVHETNGDDKPTETMTLSYTGISKTPASKGS